MSIQSDADWKGRRAVSKIARLTLELLERAVCPVCWTLRTRDGSLSAHYEHTLVITRGRPVVLTAEAA